MERVWIIGDGGKARWHVGVEREKPYGGSGFVAACNGQWVYSPWGVSKWRGERPSEIEHAICARCDKVIERERMMAQSGYQRGADGRWYKRDEA